MAEQPLGAAGAVTKAVLCRACADVVAPYRSWATDRRWRWCQCTAVGTRWVDGGRGMLEVSAAGGPDGVRVLGLNNLFLHLAAADDTDVLYPRTARQWRVAHEVTCREVEPGYLFHAQRRDCWAVVVRVGDSADVVFVDYGVARNGSGGVVRGC